MRESVLVITILGLLNFNSSINLPPSNTDLLSGATQKTWYLYGKSPEDVNASCKANSAQSLDNAWIFSKNGTFEFNRGAVTQDPTCTSGCCSDMLNVVGTWAFTNNEAGLKITILHLKDTPTVSSSEVLIDASLTLLEENRFVIKQTSGGQELTVEFRTR